MEVSAFSECFLFFSHVLPCGEVCVVQVHNEARGKFDEDDDSNDERPTDHNMDTMMMVTTKTIMTTDEDDSDDNEL